MASSPSLSTFDEIVASRQADNTTHEQGPSFAQMLRNTGTRKPQVAWPSVRSTRGKSYSSMAQSSSKDTEEEDYASVPSYSQSFLGDALQAALEQTKLSSMLYKFITRDSGCLCKCSVSYVWHSSKWIKIISTGLSPWVVIPLTKRYAIRVAFRLCRLLSVKYYDAVDISNEIFDLPLLCALLPRPHNGTRL